LNAYPRSCYLRRLTSLLLGGTLALLLATALLLLLPRSPAVAAPALGDLEVDKGVSAARARPGATLVYTIHVQNSGSVHTVGLTDTLADELTYVTGSLTATMGSFGYDGQFRAITWTADLDAQAWITFTAEVASGIGSATITNTVQITGDGELLSDFVTTEVSTPTVYLPLALRQVIDYYDSFDDTGSGWADDSPPVWGNVPQPGIDPYLMIVGYRERGYTGAGEYRLYTPKVPDELFGQHGWFKGLVGLAPYENPYPNAPYCVEAQMRFQDWAPFGATMGLLFAADDVGDQSPSKFFALCFSAGPGWETGLSWGLIREDNYVMEPPPQYHYWKTQPCGSSEYGVFGARNDPDTDSTGWNVVRVCRFGSYASVYLNGVAKGTWYMPGLDNPAFTHMGASAGAFEHLPVEARLAYFRVTAY
jgi:uncharacterized repeat protein (TIGR01451 family)